MFICVDGKIFKNREAKISLLSEGLFYGWGIFETLRSYGGNSPLLDEHLFRARKSCKFLGIKFPSLALLKRRLEDLLSKNKLRDAYIKFIFWKENKRSHFLIMVRKFDLYLPWMYKRGMRIIISPYRRDEENPLSRMKTLNYLLNLLSYREARRKNAHEALLLNTRGEVCECSRSNIFIVKDKKVFTPPLESGCLDGIVRRKIIELLKSCGIYVKEKPLSLKEVFASEEVFLTNSLMEVMPVRVLEGKKFTTLRKGNIWRKALSKYRELLWH